MPSDTTAAGNRPSDNSTTTPGFEHVRLDGITVEWTAELPPDWRPPILWHLKNGQIRPLECWPADELAEYITYYIDIRPLPNDFVGDVRRIDDIAAMIGPPHRIAAVDVIEHMVRDESRNLVADLCHYLLPGGLLHIRTTDRTGDGLAAFVRDKGLNVTTVLAVLNGKTRLFARKGE